MGTLKLLGTIYTVFHAVLFLILLILFIWRLKEVRNRNARTGDYPKWLKILKALFIAGIFLSAVTLPVFLLIASPFASLIPSWLLFSICLSLFALLICELILFSTASASLIRSKFRQVVLIVGAVVFLIFGIGSVLNLPSVYAYPSESESLIVQLPVKGIWQAGHAGGTTAVNYHCAYPSQMYAMDIMKADDNGKYFQGDGANIEDFYTLNEDIIAPADGRVVAVKDSLPNEPVTFQPNNPTNPAGNHVVIQIADSAFVFLAHLNAGSIVVKEGDLVKAGDLIGKAGNSGNTSWPHLHMHIQNRKDLSATDARGIPYRFDKINRHRILFWHQAENAYLLRNDLFSLTEE